MPRVHPCNSARSLPNGDTTGSSPRIGVGGAQQTVRPPPHASGDRRLPDSRRHGHPSTFLEDNRNVWNAVTYWQREAPYSATSTAGEEPWNSIRRGIRGRASADEGRARPLMGDRRMEREAATMPTDERYIGALRDAFLKMVEEWRLEERPPDGISFPDSDWAFFFIGPFNIVYRRSETAAAIDKVCNKIYQRAEWTRKWSHDYIQKAFVTACDQMDDLSADAVFDAFTTMARQLDEEPKPRSVIFAVGGVLLSEDEIYIGAIRLFRMTDRERERLRRTFNAIIDTVRNPEEAKEQFRRQTDEFLAAYGNLTAAEVPAIGDVERAKEDAAHISEPVLDFLQLIAAIEEPSFTNIRIVGGGDLMARQPPRMVIAADGTEANWDAKLAYGHRLQLTTPLVGRIIGSGFQSAVDAIAKNEDDRTPFEDLLVAAIHWIADAEKQDRLENRITSYMTAMELFFTSADAPITRDLSENVAYLLGTDLQNRKEIRQLVNELYKQRSKVSHTGSRTALEADVRRLKELAINVAAMMSRMAPRFTTKADLQMMFADLRLSAEFDPMASQSEQKGS